MIVTATTSLPLETVPMVDDVERLVENFIRKDLETPIEMVRDDVTVITQAVTSYTNTLVSNRSLPFLEAWHVLYQAILVKVCRVERQEDHLYPSCPVWTGTTKTSGVLSNTIKNLAGLRSVVIECFAQLIDSKVLVLEAAS
jgi:hypothetical protein